jgi:hypothetical protein
VTDLLARQYSIHFHVWIPDDIAELLGYLSAVIDLRWKVREFIDSRGSDEFIYILQKPE